MQSGQRAENAPPWVVDAYQVMPAVTAGIIHDDDDDAADDDAHPRAARA